ncbi:MAG: hypothetical protein M3346_02985, partial [Actinomycetota bacterium]|nr:hypothetical protein [Actinomycetota bacterium]
VYGYDGRDMLVSATAGPLSVQRSFDSRGRLVRESASGEVLELFFDDAAGTSERRWPDGRRERIDTNLNGVATRLTRTATGALGGGAAVVGTFAPSGPSHLGTASFAGGLAVTATYDSRRRLTALSSAASGSTREVLYRYDARSRRRVEQIGLPPVLRACRFDARDRLSHVSEDFATPIGAAVSQAQHDAVIAAVDAAAAGAARRVEYSYDSSDDRLVYKETGRPDRIYAYAGMHRPTSAGTETFTYHPTGGRASDATRGYQVDALGRVVRVTSGGATILDISYDALGRPAIVREGAAAPRALSYFGADVWQESTAGAPLRQYSPHPFMAGSAAVHVAGATLLTVFDGRFNLVAAYDTSGSLVEQFRYEPFGAATILDAAGNPIAGSAQGLTPVFGGMLLLPSVGLYLARRRLMDPNHGVFLTQDPLGYIDSPSLYAYAVQNPMDAFDPNGEYAIFGLLIVMAIGAGVAAALNATRQGVQIAEGSRVEFSLAELGQSVGTGAALAPILVAAPELGVFFAGWGVAGGVEQMSEGNYATGTFDIVTSVAPFGIKGVRNSTFGPGTRFGQMRGLGESASWGTRVGRFNEIDQATRAAASDAWNKSLYRGTSYYEASAAENGLLNLDQVFARQRDIPAPPHLGPGLYFTEELNSKVTGGAWHWADNHIGTQGKGGGPAVMEARIARPLWWWLSRKPGVVTGAEQPGFPVSSGNLETFVPESLGPWFNKHATWRAIGPADPNAPPAIPPAFDPLWPTLLTPTSRLPQVTGSGQQGPNATGASGTGGTSGPGSSAKK